MSFPMVLLNRGVQNETQDLELTTVKLTPNSHSNFQTRFQIPKMGSILDSNSALVWSISWDGYSAANSLNQAVFLKNGSGGLNTLARARFFIGGREIFSCEDVGHLIHIKNLSVDPDQKQEVLDIELGSQSGYYQSTASSGKYQLAQDCSVWDPNTNRYSRVLGSWNASATSDLSIECSVMLSDIFSALKSLQLPLDLEDMRLEIDWNTEFSEVAYCGFNLDTGLTNTTISIKEPVLLLDYLTVPELQKAGLKELLDTGYVLPFVHTSIATHQLPLLTNAQETTTDLHIALQGKLIMKMFVSQRWADTALAASEPLAWVWANGRCRSQRCYLQKYNLYINDLAIHDLPVEMTTEQYQYLAMSLQSAASVMPGAFSYNDRALAGTNTIEQVSDAIVQSGYTYNNAGYITPVAGVVSNVANGNLRFRDGIRNTQSYIGFDLSKYDEGSQVVPANAGYRCGSSAVILRISETGVGTEYNNNVRTAQVFVEEVRSLQVRNRMVDVFDN